jgi:hypothetical protein
MQHSKVRASYGMRSLESADSGRMKIEKLIFICIAQSYKAGIHTKVISNLE